MKAIVQDRFGSSDVLELRDIPVPEIGDDEVLVQVRAAGIDRGLWHLMEGKPYIARPAPPFRRMWKHPRGREVAGLVERVGAGVTGFAPGDRVMGIAEGSLAEFAAAEAPKLVHMPAWLPFEPAAAVPISGITALQAVRDVAEVQPGQRVLIVGASGGVGILATQIGKAFGAEVTGVASDRNASLVRSFGADHFIDYRREDFTDGRLQWDVIIDTAGRRPLRTLRRALTPTGTLAIVGGEGGGNWTGGIGRQMVRAPILSMFTRQRFRAVMAKEDGDDLVTLRDLVADGKVTPVIDRIFGLVEAREAVRHLTDGHPVGKIVVTV